MRYFDSHAHYDDMKFDGLRESIIAQAFEAGVERILNAASDIASSRASIALAKKYPEFYAAAGVHPHECCEIADENAFFDELRLLLGEDKVVALGEIGLDYHYDLEWKEKQLRYFDLQLSLSEEMSLPVIIHDRDAHGDCMDIIRAHPKAYGVLHSYSGSAEMAKELLTRGWYISFSGSATFKNANKLLDAVKAVPDDRIMIETDCPYLAPVPMRGKLNHSGYLPYTAQSIALTRAQTQEEIAELTYKNASRLFGLDA